MRASRIVAPVALLLALGLLVLDWRARKAVAPPVSPAIGRAFPPFSLDALPGIPLLTNATLRRGRPVLVTFFASWCLPCRAEAAPLAALRARGIAVAGIAVRDAPPAAAAFLAAAGTRFTAVGLDPHERVQPALASAGIPETWLVDGGGIVRARFRGAVEPDDVDRLAAVAVAVAP